MIARTGNNQCQCIASTTGRWQPVKNHRHHASRENTDGKAGGTTKEGAFVAPRWAAGALLLPPAQVGIKVGRACGLSANVRKLCEPGERR